MGLYRDILNSIREGMSDVSKMNGAQHRGH